MRNSSLDRLVVEHLPAALRFATRLTGDADLGEEIVQDALVRVLRGWHGFRGESAFRTWFFRIIINVFRDRLRRSETDQSPGEGIEAEPIDTMVSDPLQAAVAAELEERIALEISRLPRRQREVLVLTVYEGLSTREVAGVVGISEANVHSTLSAARSRLKSRLAPYFKSLER